MYDRVTVVRVSFWEAHSSVLTNSHPHSSEARPAGWAMALSSHVRSNDPWERPLRFIAPDKLKRQAAAEKEARLLVACWQGRDEEVKKILNSGKPQPRLDCSAQTKEEREYKVRSKAAKASTKITDLKFSKNDLFRYGSPVHKAALRGDAAIVEMLLENIAPVQLLDEKTEVGNTPLHNAAYGGHIQVCEILLDALCDVQVDVNPKTGQKLDSAANAEGKKNNQVNASLTNIVCRNRFLSTPRDKAIEANQKAVIVLFDAWPGRLKRRNEINDALRDAHKKYFKDIGALKDTAWLRALVREAEHSGRPTVKPNLLHDAKQLLIRADG